MLTRARRRMFGLREMRDWAPSAILLIALAALVALGGDRSYFYRPENHTWDSVKNLALAENLSPSRGFSLFVSDRIRADGSIEPVLYGRFPVGGPALIKIATAPFDGDISAKILAARALMLAFFAAAMVMAHRALSRVFADRWTALGATLLAFSAYYALYFSDHVSNETNMDLFGVMLVFHGMVVFAQEGRFWQLAAKTCVALLLGWHAYALLLPFIALGFGGAAWAGLRPVLANRGGFGASAAAAVRVVVGAALRSRHIALGLIALAFGCAVLGFNLANEYAAYGGQRTFAELPTVESALMRTGGGERPFARYEDTFDWSNVLGRQLVRLGGASLPYALTGWGRDIGLFAFPETHRYAAAAVAFGGLAALACAAALAFARRHRTELASLALAGACWALFMRLSVSFHQHYFEAVFYVGASLATFSIALAYVRKRWGTRAVVAAAIFAAAVFIISAYQIGNLHREPGQAEFHKAMMADFNAIREIARGGTVSIDRSLLMGTLRSEAPYRLHWAFYYLSGIPTKYGGGAFPTDRRADFAVSRYAGAGLDSLTPNNRLAFLYSASDAELHEAQCANLASREPIARSGFNLHLQDGMLSYLKAPCSSADAERPFFLTVHPADAADLSPKREFDEFIFGFAQGGKRFGGKCMINAPLPTYPIASIRTGQLIVGEGKAWEAEFFDPAYIDALYQAALASEPAARSDFDVYLDGKTLTYLKDPCGEGDTRGRFLLSVHPANPKDLPENRREMGHDSLNFDFDRFGVTLDGKCLAVRRLPDYEISKIETGQWIPGGERLWTAEIMIGE